MLKTILPTILMILICLNLWLQVELSSADREQGYKKQILTYREKKQHYFLDSNNTPLRELRIFSGLRYYPILKVYKVNAKFLPRKDTSIIFRTNRKRQVRLTWVGSLVFNAVDKPCTLQAYVTPWDTILGKLAITEPRTNQRTKAGSILMVPFRDSTNGKGTSRFGRYLDVILNTDSTAFLDFNMAYNAYSLYNPWYISPKPPKVNFLPLWIEAGERTYIPPPKRQS